MKEQVRRRRRKGRRTTVIAIRFIILAVCIIVLCSIALTNTIARYRSEALASKDIEIAMYVFKEDHQTMSFKLDQMVPRAEPYQHTFSVTNSDSNNKIAQTSIDYDITIKTTTNLPLQYVLYKIKHQHQQIQPIYFQVLERCMLIQMVHILKTLKHQHKQWHTVQKDRCILFVNIFSRNL